MNKSICVVSDLCPHSKEVVLPITLHNIMHMFDFNKKITIMSKDMGNPDLWPMINVFGSANKIKCPSGLLNGKRFFNFSWGSKHFYEYIKTYMRR